VTPEFLAARRELAWKSAGAVTWAGVPLLVFALVQPLMPEPDSNFLVIAVTMVIATSWLAGYKVTRETEPFVKSRFSWHDAGDVLPVSCILLIWVLRYCGSPYLRACGIVAYLILLIGGAFLISRIRKQLPADSPLRLAQAEVIELDFIQSRA